MAGNPSPLLILTTGGTIDKIYFDATSEYEIGEPAIAHIFHEAAVVMEHRLVSLMRKDSLDLTGEDRATIRRACEEAKEAHILITHGTDSMTETAKALSGIAGKTIVLTGALAPARFRMTDAVFNIGCALGAIQSKPPGVYIAMNGRVFDADRVRKNREAQRFEDHLKPAVEASPPVRRRRTRRSAETIMKDAEYGTLKRQQLHRILAFVLLGLTISIVFVCGSGFPNGRRIAVLVMGFFMISLPEQISAMMRDKIYVRPFWVRLAGWCILLLFSVGNILAAF